MSAKQYAPAENYEAKLEKVMSRLGIEKYNYNRDRFSCWVEFSYKGQIYRFSHSIDNAKETVRYSSDVFAQVVLALEDLARMVERGIYDLSTWVAGMKYLPPTAEVPDCFRVLGYDRLPASAEEVSRRYKSLAKSAHPDTGGSKEQFVTLNAAYEQAVKYFEEGH
jgi:DnaJ-class molecular chaperone with C-terminal Zn finger domain